MTILKHLIILLFPILISAQNNVTDSILVCKYELTKANYKDFVLKDNKIYAITSHDSLIIWDIESHKIVSITRGISAIAKTRSGEFYSATADGKIKISEDALSWQTVGSVTGKVYYLLIDRKNIPVIIASDGFYYDSKYYSAPDDDPFYFNTKYRCSAFIRKPDAIFLDSSQRIWMAFNNGEFGGDGQFFDLNTKEFYPEQDFYFLYEERHPKEKFKNYKIPYRKLKKEFPDDIMISGNDTLYRFPKDVTLLGNTKGITEDNEGNFYTAYSLMHFFVEGCIYKTKNSQIPNFYKGIEIDVLDKEKWETKDDDGEIIKLSATSEYLGPIQFNPFDKKIYFYTNNGFFQLIEDAGKYSKKFIFRPYISWTNHQTNAIGAQMNVAKFEFIDKGRFVFLTSNNGIGYYTGKEVIYYQ